MNDENVKKDEYIVPPRLNKKYLLYGFTFFEIITTIALVIISVIFRISILLPIAALYISTSYRPKNGERNARVYLLVLYRFFCKPQIFKEKECEKISE